jgi:hypothetical protein
VAGLSRSGPALSDIQIRDKVKEVRRIDKQDTRRTEGGLITVEVGQRYREFAPLFSVANTKQEFLAGFRMRIDLMRIRIRIRIQHFF